MKRMILCLLWVTLLLSGCSAVQSIKTALEPAPVTLPYSEELRALLPDKPHTWLYDGTAEYQHRMSLTEVFGSESQLIFRVSGEVMDQSVGEVQADFLFTLDYVLTDQAIIQKQGNSPLMDSDYSELTLIKLPLTEGTTWSEVVYDSAGRQHAVQSEITEVIEETEGLQYKVRYDRVGSAYFEERVLQVGKGVVHFEKVLLYDNEAIPVSYDLTEAWAGIQVTEMPVGQEVGQGASSNEGVESSSTSQEGEGQINGVPISTAPDRDPQEDERQLRDLVQSFNKAWVAYVNEGTREIENFITPDGFASKVVAQYKRGISKQRFDEMVVNRVTIQGDVANLRVYEKIVKITGEEEEVLEYHWIYEARRVDGEWKIHGYADDPEYR